MDRREENVATGEIKIVVLTPEEEAAALVTAAADAAANTPDMKASRSVDGVERLQFDVLFIHENRVRALEGKAPITVAQFRDALIARWKVLNP